MGLAMQMCFLVKNPAGKWSRAPENPKVKKQQIGYFGSNL